MTEQRDRLGETMIIKEIHLRNFRLFEDFLLKLHPQFTLLIGENGSGKTSILDALAVACGVWLYEVPDNKIANSRVPLSDDHIRLSTSEKGDRAQFAPAIDCIVSARGEIYEGAGIKQWTQEILFGAKSKVHLQEIRKIIAERLNNVASGSNEILPVIAYYGAGRAWLPHNERRKSTVPSFEPAQRWAAFYDCLNERIRIADLRQWFWDETTERGNREGKYRPGFEVVRRAILRCIPMADNAWFDTDRKDIVLSIGGRPQPFSNLSAGQRTMLAMVADIAIKCVIQNNYLVPREELGADDAPLPRVLAQTPGVVLIDEIDVHLHPRWQRRVIDDLRTTFPKIQFVATTHSPQVVGELAPESIRLLDQDGETPRQAFGMDSNWILDVLMNADDQNQQIEKSNEEIFSLISESKIDIAKLKLQELRDRINGSSEVIEKAEALIERMRLLGR